MKVKGITDECFTDYKLPAMFIAVNSCSFKCDRENGCQLCQNMALAREPDIEVSKESLIERFMLNPITKAIVFGGLEPFDSPVDLTSFIDCCLEKLIKNHRSINESAFYRIQDGIYHHRKTAFKIPDWLYNRMRNSLEEKTHTMVSQLSH